MTARASVRAEPEIAPPHLRQAIRRNLLRWYDRNARDLPWRRLPGDGYAQWVAEIMLQQTRVETVIPYYQRFMKRFPDVASLARARDDDLLRVWQGLGYYRRAANLRAAAKTIVANGGNVPQTAEELSLLPGIGRYTAGAIASIAFDRREPAVDGNVTRVLTRLFNITITGEVSHPGTQRRLWSLAESLIPRRRCGDFNQAVMDLGAAICTPRDPRCDSCPLAGVCEIRRCGDPATLPKKSPRAAVLEVRHVVAVIRAEDSYLMVKRPLGGLWGGLWEFPNHPCADSRKRKLTLGRLLAQYGLHSIPGATESGTLSHRLTHRLMRFDIFTITLAPDDAPLALPPNARWIGPGKLQKLPMSTACRKMLSLSADS